MNRKDRQGQNMAGGKQPPRIDPVQLQQAIAITLEKAGRLLPQERYEEAGNLYIDILRVEPANVVALYNLGQILALREDFANAADCLEKVLRQDPKDAPALIALARIRIREENLPETLKLLAQADTTKVSPQMLAKLYSGIGVYHATAGDKAEGLRWQEKSLTVAPLNISALYEIVHTTKTSLEDPHGKEILTLETQQDSFPAKERALLYFALGRLYGSNGQTEKSFAYYKKGNALKKSFYTYDRARLESSVKKIRRLFDAAELEKLRAIPPTTLDDAPVPVFIIGMPRSGSTLTDQILCSHPDVASVGEARFFSEAFPIPKDKRAAAQMQVDSGDLLLTTYETMTPEALRAAGDHYLNALKKRADGKRFVVNKMLFNHLYAGLILRMMPNAKIIHCRRDPADIGLSIWQLMFQDDNMLWTYDQGDIAHYYRGYRSVMNHWRGVLPPDAMLEIDYEDTVQDQESQTRRLLAFCGLPWDERCLRFYENDRIVNTASREQVRQPIYTGSVRKWQKYENYLRPLLAGLAEGDIE